VSGFTRIHQDRSETFARRLRGSAVCGNGLPPAFRCVLNVRLDEIAAHCRYLSPDWRRIALDRSCITTATGVPRYKILFLIDKDDSDEAVRQILPADRDDSGRVVVVEAAPMLSVLLADRLREDGIDVVSSSDLEETLNRSDLLTVIIAAPEVWPLEALLKSKAGRVAPVIALLPADQSVPMAGVTVFERPARLDMMVAAVRSVSRPAGLRIGPLTFDVKTRFLSDRSGTELARLTEKETKILAALLRAPAGEIERDAVMRDIWRYHDAAQSHTMETHIYRLRRKLAAVEPSMAGAIETIPGGYRLRLDLQTDRSGSDGKR
jgi:DNA-binding response OmpR family regulator